MSLGRLPPASVMISSAAAAAGVTWLEGRRHPGWKGGGIRGGRAAAEPSPGAGEEKPSPGAGAKRAGSAKLGHMAAEPTVGSMTEPLADTVRGVDVWNRRLPGTGP